MKDSDSIFAFPYLRRQWQAVGQRSWTRRDIRIGKHTIMGRYLSQMVRVDATTKTEARAKSLKALREHTGMGGWKITRIERADRVAAMSLARSLAWITSR